MICGTPSGASRHASRTLEGRAAAGQEAAAGAGDSAGGPESPAAAAAAARGWRDPIALLSLLGRLFIVLGGAYLLRAMTDAGAIPPAAGVALGLAYGLVWLVLADRAGGRGQRPAAVFHGIGAAMVAFPVVLEATTRFKVLPRAGQRGGAGRPDGRHPGGGLAATAAGAGLDRRRGRDADVRS